MTTLPRKWTPVPAAPSGQDQTTVSMGSGGSHNYGTLSNGDILAGGIWAGWKVQIPDAATYPLALEDVASGLQMTGMPGSSGHVKAGSYIPQMHGIYRDVKGDFSFECEFAGGGTADMQCGFGASAWQPEEHPRGLFCGANTGNTVAFSTKSMFVNGSTQIQTYGASINFANTSAFKLVREGEHIKYYIGSTLGSLTQGYPGGSGTKYDVVGNVCRVGLWFGGSVPATRVVASATLTYFPAE